MISHVTGAYADVFAWDTLYAAYRKAYYHNVHVGWSEHKHYKTVNKKRVYSHSTWSKKHEVVWCHFFVPRSDQPIGHPPAPSTGTGDGESRSCLVSTLTDSITR